jgi:vacuolar protein sorting-associated protein 13A/C
MDKPKDTIRVLDDLDLTVSMDSRADAGRQVTSIEAAIDPVILRVSFRDILLINSIVNRAIELSNRSNPSQPSKTSDRPALESAPSGVKARGRSKSEVTRPTATQTSSRVSNAALRAQVIVTKETVRLPLPFQPFVLVETDYKFATAFSFERLLTDSNSS